MNELVKPSFDLDVIVNIPEIPEVTHNLDKLQEYANKMNEFYNNLVIEEKDIKFAEDEKSKINTLIKNVDRLRIDKVKEYKLPIDSFETTAKQTVSLLKDTVQNISDKLDFYVQQSNNEKLIKIINPIINAEVSRAFNQGVFIKPEAIIQDKRWFNKTIKDSEIEEDITNQVESIIQDDVTKRKDIDIIKTTVEMSGKIINVDKYIERYKYTRDLTNVLSDIKNELSSSTVINENKVDFTMFTITLKGSKEQVESIRNQAKFLGMEEI